MPGRIKILAFIVMLALFIPFQAKAEFLQYETHGKRDPFAPLVGAEKPTMAKLADVTSVEDIRLEGIVSGARGEMAAMMNGEIVKKNDKFGDITVKSITKTAVVLSVGGKEHQLKLPEEGGQKE